MEQSKREQLNQKLDFMSAADLGVSYQPEQAWEKLEQKLDSGRKAVVIRWVVAATVALLMLWIPYSFIQKQGEETVATQVVKKEVNSAKQEKELPSQVVEVDQVAEQAVPSPLKTMYVQRKGVTLEYAKTSMPTLADQQPIQILRAESMATAFSENDISVIQNSLEASKAESKNAIVKARLFASSADLNVESQTLKIQFNEKK